MQTQEQEPDIGQKALRRKVPWLRLSFLALTVFIIIILGIFLIENSANSSATLLNSVFIVIAVLVGIVQGIPILFPSKSHSTTVVQHIYPSTEAEQNQQHTPPVPNSSTHPLPVSTQEDARTLSPMDRPPVSQPASITIESIFHFNVTHLPNSDELYGRKRERSTLLDRIRKGASTSIVGPRRIGKSWLLDYVKMVAPTEISTDLRLASLDGTTPKRKSVSDFIAQALDAFDVPLPSNQTNLELDMLAKVVASMQTKNVAPVLCIDEFEGFFNQQDFDCEFFEGLRYVAMNGLVLVIASKSPLMDLVSERCRTSPFFNIFEQVALKPFTKVEAEEFAQAKSKEARFNDDECVALLKYGQIDKQEWPPLRLQLVGKMLLEDKNLAAAGNPDYYQPGEQDYWKDFKQRLEEKYRGTVR